MDKISINLLPIEILSKEKESRKKSSIFKLSLGLLVFMVVLTAGLLTARLFQNQTLSNTSQDLNSAKDQVSKFKAQEGNIVYLKDRLKAIAGLLGDDSKTVASYNLIYSLTPSNVNVLSLAADKGGNITLSAEAADSTSMKLFFDHLTSPVLNQGKISSVRLDSLSKSASIYRMDLTISVI